MMQSMTGTVSGLGQKGGGGFFLRDGNDIFYSCRDAAQRAGVVGGSEVQFEFETNEANGRTFYNIQGPVQVGGAVASTTQTAPIGAGTANKAPAPAPASGGQDLRSQTIYRQNCLTQANNLIANQITAGAAMAPSAAETIAVAKEFEKYVSGEEG